MFVCYFFLTGLAFFCIAGRVYFANIEDIMGWFMDYFCVSGGAVTRVALGFIGLHSLEFVVG